MSLEKAKQRRRSIRAALIRTARSYALALHRLLGKVTIILYGSVARGDFNKASDIDILVISDCLPKRFLDRFDVLLQPATGGVEPKGYTAAEFRILAKKKNFQSMLANKIVLRDDLGIFI